MPNRSIHPRYRSDGAVDHSTTHLEGMRHVGFTHTCHTAEVDTAPQSGGRWSASGGGGNGRVQPLCRPEGPGDRAATPLSMAHPADSDVALSQ